MSWNERWLVSANIRNLIEEMLPHPIRWSHEEGQTRCPFHDDQTPSFSVNPVKGVWHCFSGCGGGSIQVLSERLGFKFPAFLSEPNLPEAIAPPAIKKFHKHEQEHIYQDNIGNPVFLVGRDPSPQGKKIMMYHAVNGQWFVGKGQHRPLPYQLPRVISAIDRGLPVVIVEGEKDADTVNNKFQDIGLVATTNMGGALKWNRDDEYNCYFWNAEVYIIPDNDDIGRKHAQEVSSTVGRYARSVSIIGLPDLPCKGDVTDWFALGNSPEAFLALLSKQTPLHEPSAGKVEIDVLRKYFDGNRFVPALLANDILQGMPCFFDGNQLFNYQNGMYRANGEIAIRQYCQRMLGNEYRINRVKEVAHYIETQTYVEPNEFNSDDGRISLLNGLFDLANRSLSPHIPERLSTIQLPVTYDQNAKCPQIETFLAEVLPADTIHTVLEFIGYCLIMNAKYEKALMLTGTGANGNSTFIKLISTFLGKCNTTSIPLQELADSRWKRADLQGTLLNSFADISSRSLETSSIFKAIVSGDEIDAERKGKDPFYFRPYAKMLFSANELPGSKDLSKAFMRRWSVVPFPNSFDYGKTADPDLIYKLTTPEELSGLLNLALDGLNRLQYNKEFTSSETTTAAIEIFLKEVDSVAAFVDDCCELEEKAECRTTVLYSRYRHWCEESGVHPLGRTHFNKRLSEQYPKLIKARRYKQPEHWEGITID
ncbi:phage/plasmid primase, P4 family [Cohnella kolymensis]|uniref:phage/plasmid primase, P4 family n=1 Tax=Cohnella kolymensis TaxID=1590652 RepID=UPI0006989ED0|nr:phage/plasmid primase, P4 family [Cohnella kolymensis]